MGGRRANARIGVRALALLLATVASAVVAVPVTVALFASSRAVGANSFQTATLEPPSGLSVTQSCAYSSISFVSSSTATGTGSVTVTKPSPVATNDLMIAQFFIRRQPVTITAPAGWTPIRKDEGSGTLVAQAAYYHIAGGSEPADYTWSVAGSTDKAAAGIAVYRGVNTSNPIDAQGGQANASSTSITAPSITTVTPDTLLVGLFGIRNTGTITPPGGMTERWDVTTSGSPTSSNAHIALADQSFVGPGATGTRVATASAGQANVGQLVALRPALSAVGASLSWTATASTFAQGYEVQRWVGATKEAEYSVTPRTTVAYDDSPITNGTPYTYEVFAYYQNWTSSAISGDLTPSC